MFSFTCLNHAKLSLSLDKVIASTAVFVRGVPIRPIQCTDWRPINECLRLDGVGCRRGWRLII